jgi:hypothetical protein
MSKIHAVVTLLLAVILQQLARSNTSLVKFLWSAVYFLVLFYLLPYLAVLVLSSMIFLVPT